MKPKPHWVRLTKYLDIDLTAFYEGNWYCIRIRPGASLKKERRTHEKNKTRS